MSRLTPAAILEALREAVTVVEPGEVLAVRVSLGTSDDERYEPCERARHIEAAYGVPVLLLQGDEFARIKRGEPS